jgi:hypothetical protein
MIAAGPSLGGLDRWMDGWMDGFHSHPAVRPSVRQRAAQTEMSEAPSSVQGICHAAWRGLLQLKLHPRSSQHLRVLAAMHTPVTRTGGRSASLK